MSSLFYIVFRGTNSYERVYKEYQIHLEDWGYCADPIDWKEFEESNKNFEKYLIDSKSIV